VRPAYAEFDKSTRSFLRRAASDETCSAIELGPTTSIGTDDEHSHTRASTLSSQIDHATTRQCNTAGASSKCRNRLHPCRRCSSTANDAVLARFENCAHGICIHTDDCTRPHNLLFLIFQSLGWVNFVSCVVLGAVIGAVPESIPICRIVFCAWAWATGQPIISAVTIAATWVSCIKPVIYFGLFGALGGLVFWTVLACFRWFDRVRPRRSEQCTEQGVCDE
jgi:hypothetical protein